MVKISKTKHVTKTGVVKKNPVKKKVNLYLQVSKKHSQELNAFPMMFAFSEEQVKEGMKKLGVKDRSELIGIGAGGAIRRKDKEKYFMMMINHTKEHKKMLQNKTYVYQMFRYELSNHEYCITYDEQDTLDAVGITIEELNKNTMWKEQLAKASKDYLKAMNGEC